MMIQGMFGRVRDLGRLALDIEKAMAFMESFDRGLAAEIGSGAGCA